MAGLDPVSTRAARFAQDDGVICSGGVRAFAFDSQSMSSGFAQDDELEWKGR